MAFPRAFQVRQERLGAVDHAPEVDAHHPLVVGVVIALHGAALGDAGVVEDGIDLAVLRHHLVGPGLHGVTLGDVDQGFADLDPKRACQFGGFLEAGAVHICQGQVAALARQPQSQGATNAGTGASDGGHFILEGLHGLTSLATWLAGANLCAGCTGLRRLKW